MTTPANYTVKAVLFGRGYFSRGYFNPGISRSALPW